MGKYTALPTDLEGFDSLAELALDMRWSWNHATDEVWRRLDLELWETTQNPWFVLQTVSREQIERLRGLVDGVIVGSARVEVLERGESPQEWLAALRPRRR